MPLGGVMEQSPPVGSIAVEKIVNITISLNPYTIWTINRVRRKNVCAIQLPVQRRPFWFPYNTGFNRCVITPQVAAVTKCYT